MCLVLLIVQNFIFWDTMYAFDYFVNIDYSRNVGSEKIVLNDIPILRRACILLYLVLLNDMGLYLRILKYSVKIVLLRFQTYVLFL